MKNNYQERLNRIYDEKIKKIPAEEREDSIFADKILGESIKEALAFEENRRINS